MHNVVNFSALTFQDQKVAGMFEVETFYCTKSEQKVDDFMATATFWKKGELFKRTEIEKASKQKGENKLLLLDHFAN